MKKLILMGLLVVNAAHARNIIGNGDGLWACKVSPTAEPTQLMLVDIFEAREQHGWTMQKFPQFMTPEGIADQMQTMVDQDLPSYSPLWRQAMDHVKANWQPAGGELEVIDDALYQIRPYSKLCPGGSWIYTQFANFNLQGQVLVDIDLWNSPILSSGEKAAMMWHEAIYYWLRSSYQDTNSIRARYIVAVLFSDLSATEKSTKISTLLQAPEPSARQDWFCRDKNQLNNKIYSAYAASEFEGRHSALASCMRGPEPIHCQPDSFIQCEQITVDHIAWACKAENSLNFESFLGRGRGRLEAEFRAEENCILGSPGVDPMFCQSSSPECTAL